MKIFLVFVWLLLLFFYVWLSVIFVFEKVVVEVVIYEYLFGGDYIMYIYELEGKFLNVGVVMSVEGDIFEVSFLLFKMFSGGFWFNIN